MNRLHMNSKDREYMIEDTVTVGGVLRMKRIRRENPLFQSQRIKEVFQLMPSKVPLNEIIKTT